MNFLLRNLILILPSSKTRNVHLNFIHSINTTVTSSRVTSTIENELKKMSCGVLPASLGHVLVVKWSLKKCK